jgi:membrane-bound inhibitor of C-type lysozyme
MKQLKGKDKNLASGIVELDEVSLEQVIGGSAPAYSDAHKVWDNSDGTQSKWTTNNDGGTSPYIEYMVNNKTGQMIPGSEQIYR